MSSKTNIGKTRRTMGEKDDYSVAPADINSIIEKGKDKLNAIPAPQIEVLSEDLREGTVIKAYGKEEKTTSRGR